MFTVALGKTFEWVQSVPEGARPRYAPSSKGETDNHAASADRWAHAETAETAG